MNAVELFELSSVLCYMYLVIALIDQTWLGKGVTREAHLRHYYFHIAGLLSGQHQPVDQVTAAESLK